MRIAHGGGKGGDTGTGFLADGVTQYGENAADADGVQLHNSVPP